MDTKVQ